tara:strand:- start:308 stop:442 length:135 start_codon:yes stop_codon:yes gene_type:complete
MPASRWLQELHPRFRAESTVVLREIAAITLRNEGNLSWLQREEK